MSFARRHGGTQFSRAVGKWPYNGEFSRYQWNVKSPAHPTLARALADIRHAAGLSRQRLTEEFALISCPTWVKLEGGDRSPSETLLAQFVDWLVERGRLKGCHRAELLDYLTALKHCAGPSPFLRRVMKDYLEQRWSVPFLTPEIWR